MAGPGLRLDRPGLEESAPGSRAGLDERCARWGRQVDAEVALTWADDAESLGRAVAQAEAQAVVVVPGALGFGDATVAQAAAAAPADVVALHPGDLRRRSGDPAATPLGRACVRVIHGRGVDGFAAAIRHLGWRDAWQPQVVVYRPLHDNVADLRMPPTGGPHPVAVLVHGGFWLDPWERDQTDGLAVDLARRGWATWNVEYRRVGSGGGWPMSAEDVAAAVDHLAALDAPLDLGAVTVIGHSAGGHLALLVAGRRAGVVRPRSVVAMAALTDLAVAQAQAVGGGAVEAFVSGDEVGGASPVDHLPLGVPVTVAHAADDGLVPVLQSRLYAQAARAAGDDVTVIEPAAGGHLTWLHPGSDHWRRVRGVLLEQR